MAIGAVFWLFCQYVWLCDKCDDNDDDDDEYDASDNYDDDDDDDDKSPCDSYMQLKF